MTETCKISDLLTNPYNRETDPAKVAHIKAEIQRTGEVYPLVYSQVDNDGKPGKMVTDGHHRFVALKELGHTEVPVVLSDERGLKTKAPKEEVEKLAKGLAKAWFGDSEEHARVAALRGASPGPESENATGGSSKSGMPDGLKNAIKVAAIGALAVGGVAALRSTAIRGVIANAAARLVPPSKVGTSAYAATIANGGHTVSMAGSIPNARYMVSPYKANEKILPLGQFKARSVDLYTKQNAELLAKPNHHLGTWHNKETGNVHLDVSLPHDNRLAALETGQKHGQLAIYDRTTGRDIPVNASTIGQAKFVDTVRERYEYAPHSWKPALHDEGFGLDVLQEVGVATARGPSRGSVSIVYNRTNGYFGVGDINREHSDIFANIQDFYGAKVQGDLDTRWARMTYAPAHGATGGSGKLNLWNWSTEFEEARGTSSKNYADTLESVIRNKNFPDDLIFGVKTPFRQLSEEKTLGEWRELYGKSKKGILTEGIDAFMKNIDEMKKPENDSTVPNRTAMAAEEQAEHPSLPAPVIAQIVQDHLKVGKAIIYKRAIATAVAQGLAKSFKPKTEKKPVEETPVEVEPTEDDATKPEDPETDLPGTEETEPEQSENPTKPAASAVNRDVPSEESAQPNTQESIEQSSVIDESLIALHSALQELEMLARDQQTMSEDEMQVIIIPLQEKVSMLLSALKGDILGESAVDSQEPTEDTSEEEVTDTEEPAKETQGKEKPVADSEATQRTRKKPQGPARKPGTDTAARELTEPASDFTGKTVSNSDLHKGFFGIGGQGRGWKGDPAGHAEAARERWAMQGVPAGGAQKPTGAPRATGGKVPVASPQRTLSENALTLPRAVKDMAVATAGRAGRGLARMAGDAIAEVGWQAFGTIAGLVVFNYLSGKSIKTGAIVGQSLNHVRDFVDASLRMSRVAATVRALKMEATLARFVAAGKATKDTAAAVGGAGAAVAGAGKLAESAGKVIRGAKKVSSKVSGAARAAGKAAKTAAQFKQKS